MLRWLISLVVLALAVPSYAQDAVGTAWSSSTSEQPWLASASAGAQGKKGKKKKANSASIRQFGNANKIQKAGVVTTLAGAGLVSAGLVTIMGGGLLALLTLDGDSMDQGVPIGGPMMIAGWVVAPAGVLVFHGGTWSKAGAVKRNGGSVSMAPKTATIAVMVGVPLLAIVGNSAGDPEEIGQTLLVAAPLAVLGTGAISLAWNSSLNAKGRRGGLAANAGPMSIAPMGLSREGPKGVRMGWHF